MNNNGHKVILSKTSTTTARHSTLNTRYQRLSSTVSVQRERDDARLCTKDVGTCINDQLAFAALSAAALILASIVGSSARCFCAHPLVHFMFCTG